MIGIPSESQQEPAGVSGEEREGIVWTKLNSVGVMEGEGASLIRIVWSYPSHLEDPEEKKE